MNDGAARLGAVVARAAELNMPALGLADMGNMFGAVKFFNACRQHGVKPIIGCEVTVNDGDSNFAVPLFCMNAVGYKNLSRLLTRAYDKEEGGSGVLHVSWLENTDITTGLIALSGGARGDIGRKLLEGQQDAALAAARCWAARFPERFYVEVWRTTDDDPLAAALSVLAAKVGLPVVATHPVQCVRAEETQMLEVRRCIAHNWQLNDEARGKPFSDKPYLLSPADMQQRFADMPEALANSVEIARRCNFSYHLGEHFLPRLEQLEGENPADALMRLSTEGLLLRLQSDTIPDEYEKRLAHEIGVINSMGFADYYLIVSDFVGWAKQESIPVGPGRGSGAGSLAAYALGITDLDPIFYGLLFERFLNPERVSMPDFDIDFCIDGRDRVIRYVMEKYGVDRVAQIVTFGQIGARGAVRDVGRVLGYPYGFSDRIARLIPFAPDMTLKRAVKESPPLAEEINNDEEVAHLYELSQQVEGLPRNIGTHAGGVLIAPAPIVDFCPLYAAADTGSAVSQLDMNDIEKVGLVKFDFLGLKTLTIIDKAEKLIRNSGLGAPDFSLEKILTDDVKAYDLYARGDTLGVFQCESRGMRSLMRRLKPDRFGDIVALMALFRPGPLDSGMADDYIRRKNGESDVTYPHTVLEDALRETYGVFVYQEQVMEAARLLSGYSLGEADLLRRAIGKKKADEMAAQRQRFVEGAKDKLAEGKSSALFDQIQSFADYAFNKSHAAAYALLSYRTAYLKAHYPAAFYAAVMSADAGDTERLKILTNSARNVDIVVLPPDINTGGRDFFTPDARHIAYSLQAIKGVGGGVVDEIERARGNKPFANLFDCCRRLHGTRQITQAALENLICAGAFDSLHDNRAAVLDSLPAALEEAARGGMGLFGDTGNALIDRGKWGAYETLANELKALGFALTGSFYTLYQDFLRDVPLQPPRLSEVNAKSSSCRIAGVYNGTMTPAKMRRGGREIIILQDDSAAAFEVVVDAVMLKKMGKLEEQQALLIVEGNVSNGMHNAAPRVFADRLYTRDDFVIERARRLVLSCTADTPVEKLHEELNFAQDAAGHCEIILNYADQTLRCAISLGDKWSPSEKLCNRLREMTPNIKVKVEY
jgi:DNA polymerase-3 subunit alpha